MWEEEGGGGGGHSYMQADYHSTHRAGVLIQTPPLVLAHAL